MGLSNLLEKVKLKANEIGRDIFKECFSFESYEFYAQVKLILYFWYARWL